MSNIESPRARIRTSEYSYKPFFKFFIKRSGPFDSVILDRRRVYILPTRTGVTFAFLLLILLIGSINYDKSLGFMLTFLLAGIGNVAMFSTWRNLAGLQLRAGGGVPVFAGQRTKFSVQLENSDSTSRGSIAISQNNVEYDIVDVPGHGLAQLHFDVLTQSRGIQESGRFRLYTTFPLGLFEAWTWIELNMSAIVYPEAADKAALPASAVSQNGDEMHQGNGLEEFAGLRQYQHGDSWRRVSWKASARSDMLYTKEFSGGKPECIWIDWNIIVAKDVEQRLSIMTRLVINADVAGEQYGLRLLTIEIKPGTGKTHYQQCLRALALYGH